MTRTAEARFVASAMLVAALFSPSAMAEKPTPKDRLIADLRKSRECKVGDSQVECRYSFNGIKLTLVIETKSREPDDFSFTVMSAPTPGGATFLTFSGSHACAIIKHGGNFDGEPAIAVALISPRTGDIHASWTDPACRKNANDSGHSE